MDGFIGVANYAGGDMDLYVNFNYDYYYGSIELNEVGIRDAENRYWQIAGSKLEKLIDDEVIKKEITEQFDLQLATAEEMYG